MTKLFCFDAVTAASGRTFQIRPALTLSPTGAPGLYCTDEPTLLLFAVGKNRRRLSRQLADQLEHLYGLLSDLYLDEGEAEDGEDDAFLGDIATLRALQEAFAERITVVA